MVKKSYAKVNLALNVEKKLNDGYHSLDMINVSVSLHDTIIAYFKKKDNNIVIKCNNINVPTDNKNVVYKVIEKFKETYHLSFSITVIIKKRIPLQSGLGGGSANAAAILKILDKKFKTHLTFLEMNRFIKDITSDGPFSLYEYPSRVKGKGEIVNPLNNFNIDSKIFLLKPISGCNTKEVFTSYDDKNNNLVNINKVIQALKDNNLDLLAKNANNSLKDSIILSNKDVLNTLDLLYQCGFDVFGITGSGSTCFGIAKDKKIYKNAKKVFKNENFDLKNSYRILKNSSLK